MSGRSPRRMGSRWRAALVFIGLVVAFGYPLVNGLTHLSHQLPLYISSAEHGRGRIGHLLCRFHLQAWVAGEINRSLTGYALGNLLTSLIAGVVVFTTLAALGVPFPLLWALWVALVDFLPMIGGALAGIPTVFFAAGHSLTAGIVTLIVFMTYTQVENHVLNPVVMSRTAKVNPLLILVSSWSGQRSANGSAAPSAPL